MALWKRWNTAMDVANATRCAKFAKREAHARPIHVTQSTSSVLAGQVRHATVSRFLSPFFLEMEAGDRRSSVSLAIPKKRPQLGKARIYEARSDGSRAPSSRYFEIYALAR